MTCSYRLLFVEFGADATLFTVDGETAAELAEERGHQEVVDILTNN